MTMTVRTLAAKASHVNNMVDISPLFADVYNCRHLQSPSAETSTVENDVPRLRWDGESNRDADDLLGEDEGQRDAPTLDEAIQFLQSCLADGPKPVQEVLVQAQEVGISNGPSAAPARPSACATSPSVPAAASPLSPGRCRRRQIARRGSEASKLLDHQRDDQVAWAGDE